MAVFARFKGGVEGTLGYYESLARQLARRGVSPAPQLDTEVARMHRIAGRERQALAIG